VQETDSSDVTKSNIEAVEAPVITSVISIQAAASARSDPEAIVVEAFEQFAGRLTAFARRAVRDVDAADDLVQDTYLRFVREVRSGRVPDNVGGWLFTACGNLIVSRGRHRSVGERMKSLLVDRSVAPSPEEHAVRTDENAELTRALAELPPDARVAILMAAAGYSSREIAEAIGRTANATMTYLCRARIRLREILAGRQARTP
jgi:RNA polymerase sigma-70 factor (ECF subfamily)